MLLSGCRASARRRSAFKQKRAATAWPDHRHIGPFHSRYNIHQSRNVTWSLFNTVSTRWWTSPNVIAPMVRDHPRGGWQCRDEILRSVLHEQSRKSIAVVYPNTRVRRQFNCTLYNATQARVRASPRRRYGFYTRRATITWPMSVSCTLNVYADVPAGRRR